VFLFFQDNPSASNRTHSKSKPSPYNHDHFLDVHTSAFQPQVFHVHWNSVAFFLGRPIVRTLKHVCVSSSWWARSNLYNCLSKTSPMQWPREKSICCTVGGHMGSIANKTSRRSRWQCVGCVIRPCVRGQHTVIGETKYVYPMGGTLSKLFGVLCEHRFGGT
jgi:hypothetical protein